MTRVVRPVRLPSLAGLKSTVIVSPALNVFFDQPERANMPGGRPSICHSTLPPLPSSTDRKIHTCGFAHFHCVTVPLSTTTFSGSKAALLWCALPDVAASSTAMTTNQVLICNPPGGATTLARRHPSLKRPWFVADKALDLGRGGVSRLSQVTG